jgi:hypothetical protein
MGDLGYTDLADDAWVAVGAVALGAVEAVCVGDLAYAPTAPMRNLEMP